jgi:hypothetical protein
MNALREDFQLPGWRRRNGSRGDKLMRADPSHHGFESLPQFAELRLREFPLYRERLRIIRYDGPRMRVQTKGAPNRLRTRPSILKWLGFRSSPGRIRAEQRGGEGHPNFVDSNR